MAKGPRKPPKTSLKKVKKLLEKCLAQGPRWYRAREDPVEPPMWRDVYQLTLNTYAMALEDVIKALNGNSSDLERTCLVRPEQGGGRPFILDPSKFSWRRGGARSASILRRVEEKTYPSENQTPLEHPAAGASIEEVQETGQTILSAESPSDTDMIVHPVAGDREEESGSEIPVSSVDEKDFTTYPPTTSDQGLTVAAGAPSWTVKEFAAGQETLVAVQIPVGGSPEPGSSGVSSSTTDADAEKDDASS